MFESFRDDLEGPAIALVTQSGHQGRPVFQGQEIGIRLTHWAPTGNEVDLEFADFTRYFADQEEVGVVACYIEGFKDGRTLMLAADHAAKLHKPIVMVKVGRTETGSSMAQSHTGHLTGSDAITDAVFRQLGVTRVDGLDELLEVSASFARTQPENVPAWARRKGEPGVCVYAISGGTGAHMADMLAAADLRLPPLARETQRVLHDGLIPAYLRVSNPVDSGGPPVADARGRQILDAIVADPKIDIVVVPITGVVAMFSEPFTRDLIEVAKTTDKPIFVVWGSPPGTDDTYYKKLLDGGLAVFRTFGNVTKAVRAYVDYWKFAARYTSAFDDAPTTAAAGGEAGPRHHRSRGTGRSPLGARFEAPARDLRHQDVARHPRRERARRSQGRREHRLPGRHEGLLARPAPQERPRARAGRRGVREGSPRRVHRADGQGEAGRRQERARIEGVLVCEMVTGGVETVVGVSQDPLFGPVVMAGLGGIFVEVLEDVTFRVPPFGRDEAERMLHELAGFKMLEGVRGREARRRRRARRRHHEGVSASRWISPTRSPSSTSTLWWSSLAARSPSMHWWCAASE